MEATWNTGGKDFATQILTHLGLDPAQIASVVSDSYTDTKAKIEAEFKKASSGKSQFFSKDSLRAARNDILSDDALVKTAELERMETDFQKNKARVLELGQFRKALPQLKEKVDILFSELSVTDDDGTEVDVFKKYQEVI